MGDDAEYAHLQTEIFCMRRSICYCEPSTALAGEVNTWHFVYTPSIDLPKGTKLRFDMQSQGRDIDWEIPSANLKQASNIIFAKMDKHKEILAKEVESPDSFTPFFEFILPAKLDAGKVFTIIVGSQKPSKTNGNRAQTNSQRRRSFQLFVDTTGKGKYEEPEVFTLDVRGSELSNIRVLTPSYVARNKRFDVIVRFEDEFGNLTSRAPEDTLIELSYEHLKRTSAGNFSSQKQASSPCQTSISMKPASTPSNCLTRKQKKSSDPLPSCASQITPNTCSGACYTANPTGSTRQKISKAACATFAMIEPSISSRPPPSKIRRKHPTKFGNPLPKTSPTLMKWNASPPSLASNGPAHQGEEGNVNSSTSKMANNSSTAKTPNTLPSKKSTKASPRKISYPSPASPWAKDSTSISKTSIRIRTRCRNLQLVGIVRMHSKRGQ